VRTALVTVPTENLVWPHSSGRVPVTCYATSSYVVHFKCALSFGEPHEQETPNQPKKNSQNVKHFSLKDFAGFLPISKIRRRLSLDSSLTAVTENDSSSAPDRNSLTTFAILPPAIGRTRVAPWGSLAAARRNFNFRLPTFTVPLNQVRREVAFTNPMRCPARII